LSRHSGSSASRECAQAKAVAAQMFTPGKYLAWFKTPVGEGSGEVVLDENGELRGGDSTFNYLGKWMQTANGFKATYTAKRIAPGPPGVFGLDELDIVLMGQSDGSNGSATGFAKQSPGLKLEVTFVRIDDEP
jgi:hypothetical protein